MYQINIYSTLSVTLISFIFTTLTQTLWPFAINQLLGAAIFVQLLYIEAVTMKKKECVVNLVLAFSIIISFLLAKDVRRNISDSVYWIVTCVVFMKLADKKVTNQLYRSLCKQRKYITYIVAIANGVVILSLFLPICYATEVWGGGKYFQGFSVSSHTFSSGICMLLSLQLFLFNGVPKKWWHLLFFLPGFVAIMESGARVFMVSALIICVIYYICFIRNQYIRYAFFPLMILGIVTMFVNSSMQEKFDFVYGNQYISHSFLGQLTSGRSEFWVIDWNAFWDYSLVNKLFGNGFDHVYDINEIEYGMRIWAHNDLLNLLLSVGLLGTFTYALIVGNLIAAIRKRAKTLLFKILFIVYLLFPMMANGVFLYQHYIYSAVFLYFILLGDVKDERFSVCDRSYI